MHDIFSFAHIWSNQRIFVVVTDHIICTLWRYKVSYSLYIYTTLKETIFRLTVYQLERLRVNVISNPFVITRAIF